MVPVSSVLMFLLMAYVLPLALCGIIGYLLGSINWSIILTRLFKNKEDIRNYGSGNAGMTNVLRSVGKLPAALTFVGDFLKCVSAVLWVSGRKMYRHRRRHDRPDGLAGISADHCDLPSAFPLEADHFPGFRFLRSHVPCIYFSDHLLFGLLAGNALPFLFAFCHGGIAVRGGVGADPP